MNKLTSKTLMGMAVILPLQVSAIELTDYSNPESRYDDAFVEGKINTQSGNQDQTSYSVNLNLDWQSVYSSLPRTWTLTGAGLADISRGPNDGDEKQESISAGLSGTVDNYLHDDNGLFWFGSGDLGYIKDAEDPYAKVGAGLGYGRVINATPLAKVLRIEEELREHRVIRGELSRDTYLALARVIDRESEFKSRFGADEYKPHFFAAIEAVLNDAKVLANDSLGATGALFIDRVLYDEAISTRRHGWLVRGGAGLVVQDYTGESDNDPSIDLAFQYAKPFGYKSQFDNTLSYSTIFADNTDQLVRNRMSYTYELSDRVDWENAWTLDFQKAGSDDANDILTNALSTTARYYLTNRVAAGATLSASRTEDDIDGNGNDDTSVASYFDLRYRLK